jgi:hypothetical protein
VLTPVQLAVERGWPIILLQRNKKPVKRNGKTWITTDPGEIERHEGNWGVTAANVAIIDFDKPYFDEMTDALGMLPPTVRTGSGKLHSYVAPVDGLPRYYFWRGEKVGEIARLPSEYVVCPPSIHPDRGRRYEWIVEPERELYELPVGWRDYLLNGAGANVPPPASQLDRPWFGPSADELLARALKQPGARKRRQGVKFQCPGCRAEGHDRSRDNAFIRLDGRWGCAVNDAHRRAIGEALGVKPAPSLRRLTGLRGLSRLRGL